MYRTAILSTCLVSIVLSCGPDQASEDERRTCAVTLPSDSPADLTAASLPADRFAWYGNDALAVMLPKDGVYCIAAASTQLEAKMAWHRFVAGKVEIHAELLDGSAAPIRAAATDGYGSIGFNPSGIPFSAEGCWRIIGTIDGHDLTFVMSVRKALPSESAP